MTQPKRSGTRRPPLIGRPTPRVAPPTPARSLVDKFIETAESIGIELFPWQKTAARYLTALGRGDAWLYRHVAIVVARQNGKTRLLVPLIVSRLRMGHKIAHTAQDRNTPRDVFSEVADIMVRLYHDELAVRNGRTLMPRFANGQEEIHMRNGGVLSIVAPTPGGVRGFRGDLVIIDELREMKDHGFIGAANPTLQASTMPQMLYLSNAGDDSSVVLNAIKHSVGEDPTLAYLEWSAAETRSVDDQAGWLEANPSIGHLPGMFGNLEADLQTYRSRGELAIFETENLTRWVTTMRELLVNGAAWILCKADLGKPIRPSIAVSLDAQRAAVAIAWRTDEGVALRLLENVTGNPVDTDELGQKVKLLASRLGVKEVGGDSLTDAEVLKYVRKKRLVIGKEYAAASAQFVNLVNAGRLQWADADPITDDLTWTSRKPDGDDGSYHAVRAKDDRPIPASLAAIRAVWLASGPTPATPRVM